MQQEQNKFWSKVIDEDTRKHRIEMERKKMAKFRKNLEVQKFLKDQMAHVERQREINLVKKQEDFSDVNSAAK